MRARGDQDGFGTKATGYPPLLINFQVDGSRTTSDSHQRPGELREPWPESHRACGAKNRGEQTGGERVK